MKKYISIIIIILFSSTFIFSDSIVVSRYSGQQNVIDNVDYLGRIEKNFLGITLNQTKSNKGLRIKKVIEGSPAFISGLKPGDIITSIDKNTIRTSNELINYLSNLEEGSIMNFSILRKSTFSNSSQSIKVILGYRSITIFKYYNNNKLYSINTNKVVSIIDNGISLEPFNDVFYNGRELEFFDFYFSTSNNKSKFYSKSSNSGPVFLSISGLSYILMTQAMKTANDSNDIDRIETLNDIFGVTLFFGGLLLHSQLNKIESKIEQIDKSI